MLQPTTAAVVTRKLTMSNITVLGAGSMGTACAWILSQRPGNRVCLWARNPDYARQIQLTRRNDRLLPNVSLPESIEVSSDGPLALKNADVVLLCIPMRGLRDALASLAPSVPTQATLVSAIKGIENASLKCPSAVLREFLPSQPVVALGGPCHAEEVVQRKPASIVAASADPGAAEQIQALMATEFLRIYANPDLFGVELGGALKNVIAIAAGICDGLGFGDNAKAALITRGLSEMVRFGTALGAESETFFGLAGLGDLVTTCNSRHSRNRFVGEELGKGIPLQTIEQSMAAVAEGVLTARSVHRIAAEHQIDMPIADQVYQVLFEGKSPWNATVELMNRPLKFESHPKSTQDN